MYLSDRLLTLDYESGADYVLSIEKETDTIRLFWPEEDNEYQCFTTFNAIEDGEYLSLNELEEKANKIIEAHKLEPSGTLRNTHEHITQYPPE